MRQKFVGFSHRGPDNITEELVAALSTPKAFEFKALFEVVHAALKARNAASGGEEMLRLRAYDKLQSMVAQGQVKKVGKQYKGVSKPIQFLAEQLRDFRKNGPSFTPRPPNTGAKAPAPAKAAPKVKAPKAVPVAKISRPTKAPKTPKATTTKVAKTTTAAKTPRPAKKVSKPVRRAA